MVETLERKLGIKLTQNGKEKLRDLEKEFLSEFWSFVPCRAGTTPIEKRVICVPAVASKLACLIEGNGNSIPAVTLDRIYVRNADWCLEVTRKTDPKTGKVEITERAGSEPLEKQIEVMKDYLKKNRVVLCDVGAFEGGTLLTVCMELERRGVSVEMICLGICSGDAYRKLKRERKVATVYMFNLYEWVELRDLLGIDGRYVGMRDGKRLFIPYWETLSQWASISREVEKDAANLCKEYNRKLMKILQEEGCDVEKIGIPVKYGGK